MGEKSRLAYLFSRESAGFSRDKGRPFEHPRIADRRSVTWAMPGFCLIREDRPFHPGRPRVQHRARPEVNRGQGERGQDFGGFDHSSLPFDESTPIPPKGQEVTPFEVARPIRERDDCSLGHCGDSGLGADDVVREHVALVRPVGLVDHCGPAVGRAGVRVHAHDLLGVRVPQGRPSGPGLAGGQDDDEDLHSCAPGFLFGTGELYGGSSQKSRASPENRRGMASAGVVSLRRHSGRTAGAFSQDNKGASLPRAYPTRHIHPTAQ